MRDVDIAVGKYGAMQFVYGQSPFLTSGSPLFADVSAQTNRILPPFRMLLPTPQHRCRYCLTTIAAAKEDI